MHYERPDTSGSHPALVLLPTLGVGGSETKFIRVVNALTEQGAPIHIGYFNPPDTLRASIDDSVPVVDLERRGKYSIGALRRLRDYVVSRRIGTIVTVNFYPLAYAVPLRAWRRLRQLRVVASVNATYLTDRRELLFMRLYGPLLKRVDQIAYGCRFQRDLWCRSYGLDPARSKVIYNGVDCGRFDAGAAPAGAAVRQRFAIPTDGHVIVCVGQLRSEKAHWLLIEALALLRDRHALTPHLLLIGSGPERQRIERLAVERGVAQQVHMAGRVSDVRPFLGAADIFALASVDETFSNAALEAGAMSLPVVMSDVGGAMEMYPTERDGGLLFPAGDADGLAGVLAALVADPQRLQRMGESARRTVCERFTRQQMVAAWRRVLWDDAAVRG